MIKALFLALLLGLMAVPPAHAALELHTYGAGNRTCHDFLEVLGGMDSKPAVGFCEQLIDPVDSTHFVLMFRNWTWGFLSAMDYNVQISQHLLAGLNMPPIDGMSPVTTPDPAKGGLAVFNTSSQEAQKSGKRNLWGGIVAYCQANPDKTYGTATMEVGRPWLESIK